jgi:hypothetical protein
MLQENATSYLNAVRDQEGPAQSGCNISGRNCQATAADTFIVSASNVLQRRSHAQPCLTGTHFQRCSRLTTASDEG